MSVSNRAFRSAVSSRMRSASDTHSLCSARSAAVWRRISPDAWRAYSWIVFRRLEDDTPVLFDALFMSRFICCDGEDGEVASLRRTC